MELGSRFLSLNASMCCENGLKKDLIVVVVVVVISLLSNLSVFDRFVYIFVWSKNIYSCLQNWIGLTEIYFCSWLRLVCRVQIYFYINTKLNRLIVIYFSFSFFQFCTTVKYFYVTTKLNSVRFAWRKNPFRYY